MQKRIEERFGGSSLSMVCRDLARVANKNNATIAHIHKNRPGYRIGVFVFVATVLGCSAFGLRGLAGFAQAAKR